MSFSKPLSASLCVLLFAGATHAGDPAPPVIRHSDVVFMYDNPALYEAFGCTVLGWAGRADREHIARAHEAGVRQFSVSVGFRTEFRQVIDFSDDFLDAACRNFAGEPFVVPWLWDHEYKGQSAWHWCTNSPLYRKYLDSRLEQRMTTGCDGLHIDDYTGTAGMVTWQSACFCKYCTVGFREYLAKNVPAEKLAAAGVEDLEAFDYRRFLLDMGVTAEDYNGRRGGLPLAREFLDYQVKAADRFVADYRRRAEEIRGKRLSLCVNASLTRPDTMVIARQLSYVCCEVGHNASKRAVATHPIAIYKMADGLGLPITSTASGHDWAFTAEHDLPGLVRTWIALSYAMGHNFMAPHRQWCYNKEKGTHWHEWPAEEFTPLYQFVRRNARLLDDYEAVCPVAVVYDAAGRRANRGNIEPILLALAERNVPFTVIVAGDDWLDYRLSPEQLARFQTVIAPDGLAMDAEQQQLLDKPLGADTRVIAWAERDRVMATIGEPVVVEGSTSVGVQVRVRPDDPLAPVVVHLLNRQYDAENDTIVPQKDFVVRLDRDLLPFRAYSQATVHTPTNESAAKVTLDDQAISITLDSLDLWSMVELR